MADCTDTVWVNNSLKGHWWRLLKHVLDIAAMIITREFVQALLHGPQAVKSDVSVSGSCH